MTYGTSLASAGLHRKVVEAWLATQPIARVSSAGAEVHGVEVNGPDESGRTPLMLAATMKVSFQMMCEVHRRR